jgi:hypothetical protein
MDKKKDKKRSDINDKEVKNDKVKQRKKMKNADAQLADAFWSELA